MTSKVLKLLLITLGVVFPLFAFEVGYRIETYVRKGIPLGWSPKDKWDQELGWLGIEHVLGDEDPAPVLVLGDSFTEGLEVPKEKLWFSEVARALPNKRIIAYGGLGYGTLQELIVLRRYLRTLSPSLIILQLCSNDFINNSKYLEQRSYLQRFAAPRPYLVASKIELGYARDYDYLLMPLISNSRVAYKYAHRWDERQVQRVKEQKLTSVEFEIQRLGFSFEPFRQSIRVTEELLSQVRRESRDTPLVFVLVDPIEPYRTAFKDIARRLKVPLLIPFDDGVIPPNATLADQTHFNETGNTIVGERVVAGLRAQGFNMRTGEP